MNCQARIQCLAKLSLKNEAILRHFKIYNNS